MLYAFLMLVAVANLIFAVWVTIDYIRTGDPKPLGEYFGAMIIYGFLLIVIAVMSFG